MKRLSEEASQDRSLATLADLFRTAAPFRIDPFRKRRILVRLERLRGPRRFRLRPSILAVLFVSGTATAALGHRYILGGSDGPAEPAAALASTHAITSVSRATPLVQQEVVATHDRGRAQPEPEPVLTRPATKSTPRIRPSSSEEATYVAEAIQALRTERDPGRAQALLDDYLQRFPRGVLLGDALALSLEAASARHDPRALNYARRYLANFPEGTYRSLAERTLEVQH